MLARAAETRQSGAGVHSWQLGPKHLFYLGSAARCRKLVADGSARQLARRANCSNPACFSEKGVHASINCYRPSPDENTCLWELHGGSEDSTIHVD